MKPNRQAPKRWVRKNTLSSSEHSAASLKKATKSAKPKVSASEFLKADEGENRQTSDSRSSAIDDTLTLLRNAQMLMKAAGILKTHYRLNQRKSVLQCYDAALILSEDDEQWTNFCELMHGELDMQQEQLNRDKVLLLTLLYAMGSADKAARQSVSLFVRALRPSFKAGHTTAQVLALLERMGWFRKLAKANSLRSRGGCKPNKSVTSRNEPVSSTIKPRGPKRWSEPVENPIGRAGASITINAHLPESGVDLLSMPLGSWIEIRGCVEAADGAEFRISIEHVAQIS